MDVVAALATDVGRWRQINEDRGYLGRSIWVVADGMGGHAAGDVASALAVDAVASLDEQDAIAIPDLHAMVATASAAIRAYGDEHAEAHGLGTTIAGLAVVDAEGPGWAVFNVGDSRVYRFVAGRLEQATVDHTEVDLLVRGGVISPDEARRHPARNIVTQSLGSSGLPKADVRVLRAAAGERFVLCSDGLTGEVPDETIAEVLAAHPLAQDAADTLLRLALEAGGHDNVTVLVVDPVAEPDDEDDTEVTIIRPITW